MRTTQRPIASKIAQLFAILDIWVTANSCGHSEASPPVPSMDAVMQGVRDYGRGHPSSVLAPPSPIPQETEDAYRAKLGQILRDSDFAQLEKIAGQNRVDRGLLQGGVWKTFVFYDDLSNPSRSGPATDDDYQKLFRRLNQWIAAFPDSAAARITLARLYANYASFARGDGAASEVSGSQWKSYNERTALAEQTLLDAARLKDRDAHWYQAMQQVSFRQGWDQTNELELLHQAVAFEPSYYNFYREYGDYLKPQWYGQPGDIAQFAEQESLRLKDPEGSILYFRIASSLACNCGPQIAELPGINWPKFKSGYSNVTRLYGFSNLNANRLAWVAYKFGDKVTAQQAFRSIDHMEMEVWWGPHTFANARDWANQP